MQSFTLENVGTAVNYQGIFIILALGANVMKQFTAIIYNYSTVIYCHSSVNSMLKKTVLI